MWDWPRRRAEDWVGSGEPSAPSASRKPAVRPTWEVASCWAWAGAVPRAVSGVRRAIRTRSVSVVSVCRLPRSVSPGKPSARAVARVRASCTLAEPRMSTARMPEPITSSKGRMSGSLPPASPLAVRHCAMESGRA
ncbi:hypothetical protein GCM10010504_40240 [Streptomyces griseus]|nr:hypothetical protein GCM10010504_40240 [Streptomyces griseus]